MSFGKLYSYVENPRTTGLLSVAKENGLDVELVEVKGGADYTPELTAKNPLKRIPVFEQADGFFLTESLAIAIYFASQNEKTTLLGKSKQEYAQILKWMSFSVNELLPAIAGWFRPLVGKDPYNKKSVETSQAKAMELVEVMEKHLSNSTYLVGERITLADYYSAGMAARGFEHFFDIPFRKQYPNVSRWWATITNQSSWAGKFNFIDEAKKNVAPKVDKPAKPAAQQQAPKPKAEPKPKPAADDEEEEDKPAPKPKHPLGELPRASLDLEEWKRKYSNSETRTEAMPWFWEHYKPEEYSLWRVDYKYNEELTQVFMTSNLIGGFFNRLEASRKYIFGSCSVYGETGNSAVAGAFVIRGDDHKVAFDVAPDWESYDFKKLDPSNEADKEFIESMWAWDKPLDVNGKELAHADGKVFK